mmetsp:Transcript_61715/g.201412  ORF Transcript_61715/g.201412 Transcript_61715/m.201412 type:complete len:131 (-) Transcript_61715:432-824(-)
MMAVADDLSTCMTMSVRAAGSVDEPTGVLARSVRGYQVCGVLLLRAMGFRRLAEYGLANPFEACSTTTADRCQAIAIAHPGAHRANILEPCLKATGKHAAAIAAAHTCPTAIPSNPYRQVDQIGEKQIVR